MGGLENEGSAKGAAKGPPRLSLLNETHRCLIGFQGLHELFGEGACLIRSKGVGRIFFGEQGDLLGSLIVLAKELDALAPRGFLTAVEFPQIQDVALHDAITTQAAVFHHAPVEVLFAIFAPISNTTDSNLSVVCR